ncbi:MAG TPA: TonB-dependent receptor [Candidatus Sulfopaludibacter sp.]|nr:TonB-dependent receptor [Candidatus Sulfopaludibacter sp.]
MSAGLEGYVTDSTAGRVAGAAVVVRDTATHQQRETATNADGLFVFAGLSAGTYEVRITENGFAPFHHAGVTLPLGSTVRLDVVLQPGNVTTQLTVTAQPSALEPAQTSVTSAVDTERIEELPVESRNYLNFVLLAPGVTSSGQTQGPRATAALADSGFSFGGLRGRSNNVAIDGLDNNDEYAGSSRTELSLETIQEFQVVNAGLSAETGGASGGSINVITRVGANDLHGDAFVFAGNGGLNAREPFETESARPSLHRYRAGVALGGPLVHDRTFYYAAFEQEHSRSLEDAFISPSLASAINRILASGAYPFLPVRRISDNFFPAARAETEASAKVNHQLSTRNSLMLRYAFTNNREAGDGFNTAGWTDPSARGSSFTRDNAVVGSFTTAFSPVTVGDFRFQLADRTAVLRTNDATGAGMEIAGLVNFGRPYQGNGRRNEQHDQATYTWSRAEGRHLWKAGVALNRVHLDAAMADGFGATWIFADLASFAAGQPSQVRQTFGQVGTNYAVQTIGAFVQDHWSLSRNLTVDYGMRYDVERLPAPLRTDANNVSPRAGIAWHPAAGWVLRAGYGIFFDRYVLASLNQPLQVNGVQAFEQVFGPSLLPVLPSIYRTDPRMATPYSQQSSFAVERLIAHDLTATASFQSVRGTKLARTRNVNYLGALDPRYADIFQLEDSAASRYQGVSFTVNRRMADEFEFSASYTLSKTYDNASDFDEQPLNPFALGPEWAVSRQQQQQRVVANALWEVPIGDEELGKPPTDNWVTKIFGHIELAPIFTLGSGRPVNPLTGVDTYGTHAYPLSARPAGFGRNSLRTPLLANMDFRVLKFFPLAFSKTAHIDLVAEAFNLLNRANVSQINPVVGPGFLQPLAGSGARQIQFSLDFEW